jgi:alpha-galactosidase
MSNPMKVTLIGASGWYAFDIYRRVFADERMRPIELRIWNRNPKTAGPIAEMLDYVQRQSGIAVDFNLYDGRKEALRGADYVLFASCVDYPRASMVDREVCARFGVHVLEGETMSPAGLMNTFRHGPIAMDVARDLMEVSPNAVIIPVSNPLYRMCDLWHRYSKVRFIGHCDGIIHTKTDLAKAMGIDPTDVEVIAGGLNHLTFIFKMWNKRTGEDLLRRIDEALPHIRQLGPFGFRFSNAVYKLLGHYISPGDNHVADQLPFVSRRMQEITPIPSLGVVFPPKEVVYAGNAANVTNIVNVAQHIQKPEILKAFLHPARFEESGDWMLALHGRTPGYHVEAINIPNDGHITNLPKGAIVEVPGRIDQTGPRGFVIGDLPPAIATLCHRMVTVHQLAVDALVHRSREAALQSIALEPAVKDLYVVEDLLDALLDANSQYLDPELVSALRPKSTHKRIALVEPAPENPLRPDAPTPETPPRLDVVAGTFWGAEMGNLTD